jgi:hypothetical protein
MEYGSKAVVHNTKLGDILANVKGTADRVTEYRWHWLALVL